MLRPCPHCKSSDVRFSRRGFWLRALARVVPVRPYRCRQCQRRFWAAEARPSSQSRRFRIRGLYVLVVAAALLAIAYVTTLPYAAHAPRPPGQRASTEPSRTKTAGKAEAEIWLYRGLQSGDIEGDLEVELLLSSMPESFDHFLVPEAPSVGRPGRFSLDLPGLWEPDEGVRWGSETIAHPLATRVRVRSTDSGLQVEIDLAPGAEVRPRVERGDQSLRIVLEPITP